MTTSRKILTVALTAVALTAVSVAASSNAVAGWKHHHHHHFGHWYGWGGVYLSAPVVSSCWQWVHTRRGFAKIYVCY